MDWEAEGLVDDCASDEARTARRALLDRLHDEGVSLEDLRPAVEDQRLALLPVERQPSSGARYSAREIAEKSGLDLEFFQTQQRALGLAVPDTDERVYGENDLEMARLGNQYRQGRVAGQEEGGGM